MSVTCRRCMVCKVDWPSDYRCCPECERDTVPMPSTSIPEAEAHTRATRAEFERFYQRREAERGTPAVDELIASVTETA